MRCTPHPDIPSHETVRAAVERLEPDTAARWGEMDVLRMMEHCTRLNRMYLGRESVSWWIVPITRLFRGMLLRRFLETSPFDFPRGVRTLPALEIEPSEVDGADFEAAKAQLLDTLDRAREITGTWDHPLYGSIDAELGKALVRTHTTHHLHQFGEL